MRATVIPVNEDTLDIITPLNNGVTPLIEDQKTYFVYMGEDEVPEILTSQDMNERHNDKKGRMHMHVVGHFVSKEN